MVSPGQIVLYGVVMIAAEFGTDASWAERALDASGIVLMVADADGKIFGWSAGASSYFEPTITPGGSIFDLFEDMTASDVRAIATGRAEPMRVMVRACVIDAPLAGPAPGATLAPMGDGQRVVCTVNTVSAHQRALGEVDDIVRAASSEGVWDWDIETDRVWWSPALMRIFGREGLESSVAPLGDRFGAFIHPSDFPRIEAALDALLRGQTEEYRIEARFLCENQQHRWFLVRGCAMRRADGTAYRVAGSLLDIHDRKEAEQALRESQWRASQLEAHMPQFVWEASPDGIVDKLNERFYEVTHAPRTLVNNEGWLAVVHPDDRDRVMKRWSQSLSSGEDYSVEMRVWHETARSYRWILAMARAARDSTNRIVRWYGTGTDIHAQKIAELAVRESEERFRAMANSAPVAIWLTDTAGRLLFMNKIGLDFIGAIQEDDHDACVAGVHPDDVDWVMGMIRNAAHTGEGFTIEFRVKHTALDYRWVLCTVAPRQTATGELVGVVGVGFDIHDRKAEESRSQRLMSELDHRVKNNLGAIIYMAERTLTSATSLEAFGESFKARLHAMARTHDALARERWTGVSLHEVIRMAIEPFEPAGSGRVQVAGPPVRLTAAKAGPMGIVLHELASNAARHGALGDADGTLTVEWTTDKTGELELHWQERRGKSRKADREPITPRAGDGLGLVEGLVNFDLRGWVELDREPENGVRHRLGFMPDGAESPIHSG